MKYGDCSDHTQPGRNSIELEGKSRLPIQSFCITPHCLPISGQFFFFPLGLRKDGTCWVLQAVKRCRGFLGVVKTCGPPERSAVWGGSGHCRLQLQGSGSSLLHHTSASRAGSHLTLGLSSRAGALALFFFLVGEYQLSVD